MRERDGYPGSDNLPPEVRAMADASMRALDLPGGPEILERMIDGTMEIPDGLVALLVLSEEYERR